MFVRSVLLQRYGNFTDREINFGPGGLSLVIGPNEAGKSTALEALSDLLWGIPTTSNETFLYGRPALAIQAVVSLADGDRLGVVRRSTGLSRVDNGEQVIPAWQTAVDSRDRWRQSFGLSHAQLRKGGEQLCQGGGDLSELVFAARSGQAVRELLADIDRVADSLYKDHRGNKSVAVRQAFAEYETARQQVESATAGAREVEEAREAAEQATLDVQRADQRVKAARADLHKAEQRQRAAAHARSLAEVLARVVDLESAGARFADGQLCVYDNASQQLGTAEVALAGLSDEIAQLSVERSGIVADRALIADAEAVRRLQREAEARMDDAERAEQLRQEATELTRQAAARLEDLLGAPATAEVPALLADLHVPADREAQLDALAKDLSESEQRLGSKRDALHDAARRLAEAGAGGSEPDDDAVAAVRETQESIQADGSGVAMQRDAVAAEADALRRREEALRIAGLPAGHPVPDVVASPAVVREAGDALTEARGELDDAQRQVDRARAALEGTRGELETVGDGDLRSPEDLHEARGRRDHTVGELIDAWQQGRPVLDVPDLAGRVRETVSVADRISDLLLEHADAAARRDELTKRLDEQESLLADALRVLADRTQRMHELDRRWATLWEGLGNAVPDPTDAAELRRHLEDARVADEEVTEARTRILGLQPQVDRQHSALSAALGRAGRHRPDADLDSLLRAAGDLLSEVDAGREERARLDQLINFHSEKLDQHNQAVESHEALVVLWRAQLRAAGLADDIGVAGWQRRRDLLDEAQTLHRRCAELSRHAQDAAGKSSGFLSALRVLAARHDVPVDDPLAAAAVLSTRLDDALDAQRKAGDLDSRIAKLRSSFDDHGSGRKEALEVLQDLCGQVGLGGVGELAVVAERTREIRELGDEHERLGELIRAAAPDLDPRSLLEEHAEPEVLQQACEVAELELGLVEAEWRDAIERRTGALKRSLELENAEGAAELEARAQQRLSVVAERVERYLLARFQSEVLRAELLDYERKHSSPLLDEAGSILQRLTGGRYVALGVINGSNGRGLGVIGADEELRTPGQLSEGTADQVFLALRLAGIASLQAERSANGSPSLPVVFDDVLRTFDDERAAAALSVMAELSERWQIIVLSHHAHLSGVARTVGSEAVTVAHVAPPAGMVMQHAAAEIRERARTAAVAAPAGAVPRPVRSAGPPVGARPAAAGPPVGARPAAAGAEVDASPGAIREWARVVGYEIGERGRIPAGIIAAYQQAHR